MVVQPAQKRKVAKPPLQDSRLIALASSLPSELIDLILQLAANDGRTKLSLLLLNKYHSERLWPSIYASVCLCSTQSLIAFASLVRKDAKLARLVKRVWIGPDDTDSDMITALSPPVHNENTYITELRNKAHEAVRVVLRTCRKLHHVALSGELLSTRVAHTYGSACQPLYLTSINPHSFVGGFSAPIFRKVKVLHIVDTNLAFEEADEIRTLADLEWLVWSALKDYGDITRDTNVLRRLLQRPRRHLIQAEESGEATPATAEGDGTPAPVTDSVIDALWTELSSLEVSEGLAPARPSKNDKFRRLTIRTARNRCQEYRHNLETSYPLLPADVDDKAPWQDAEWDPSLNMPTIHPTPMTDVMLDEWDALRDLINQAGGGYSGFAMFDEAEVDAGNALRRQRIDWENASV